jgi:hypothetical protein
MSKMVFTDDDRFASVNSLGEMSERFEITIRLSADYFSMFPSSKRGLPMGFPTGLQVIIIAKC